MSFTIPNGWTVDTNLQLLPVGNVNNNLTTYLKSGVMDGNPGNT